MKKYLSLFVLILITLTLISCKKKDLDVLQYTDIMADSWLQANVLNKNTKKRVLWFQVFDQIGEKSTIDSYKNSTEKVGEYPASISKDKWIWLMVNDRIEIRLLADNDTKDFQDTEKLKKFIMTFDLSGMEKISGNKVTADVLKKYIPKLN